MAIERPTFHESWYRVAELHPRLRTTVQISRQHFRGQPWHVVQDHTNNAFFRLAEPAYRFVGLLDGRRSVAEAWKMVNEQLGDEAPTQGEAIQLLGQLYTANLLQAEVPADAHTLFLRYKKRRNREVSGYLMNIMFARIPLVDPDAFLERWLPLVGWIFSPVGFIVWAVLIALGIHQIMQVPEWTTNLLKPAQSLLSPDNLFWLYLAFAGIKACHEMGHAISCKKFGRQSGTGGEVHVIGIMLLVFTPVPYVDASSSWALRNKYHRAIVGAAGMWVELAIAAIAAMVWANTGDSTWLHAFAYNIMFVASFSTVIFNANPLLRYDGYYILADLLEIPNLGQRANEYVYYLVKRFVWNVRFARNPAYSLAEEGWLLFYAITSFAMRMLVSFSIMFYLASVLNGALIVVAAGMGLAALITWVGVPIGRFLHYLVTSGELMRVRTRAIATTVSAVVLAVALVGIIPMPDHARAQGVVEPLKMRELFAASDGFVTSIPPLKSEAIPGVKLVAMHDPLAVPEATRNSLIVSESSPDITAELDQLKATIKALRVQYAAALKAELSGSKRDFGRAPMIAEQIESAREQLANVQERAAELKLRSPQNGVLSITELETKEYGFLKRGDRVGVVADLNHLIIRAAAANALAGPLDDQASRQVEIRVNNRPDILLKGTIVAKVPAGTNQLPSAALGYQVGGEFNTAADDRQGTKTVEKFFEVRIDNLDLVKAPDDLMNEYHRTHQIPLFPGQRVVVRFNFREKPIASQAWTALLQMFQKKFKI